MQNLIKEHTNPIKFKKPFIKKNRTSNMSFIQKPNLQVTKASNRFSLDRTSIFTDRKPEQMIKSGRNTYLDTSYPQILEQVERPHTVRPSMRKPVVNNNRASRRSAQTKSQLIEHKSKLEQILQSIDLNTSMIKQLFECQNQIDHFKEEIEKSVQVYKDLHLQLKNQIQVQKQRKKVKKTLNFIQEDQKQSNQILLSKLSQLRLKNSSFKNKQEQQKARRYSIR